LLMMVGLTGIAPTSIAPTKGQTFPLQDHGTIYVHPWQGYLFYGLLAASIVLVASSVFILRAHGLWYVSKPRRKSSDE
jgi:hypothetical protein